MDEFDYVPKSCIGCGYCCRKARCVIGAQLHGIGRDCLSLIYKEGRYWCKEVLEAQGPYKENLYRWLAIGDGCCSPMNTDRLHIPLLKKDRCLED